MSSNVYLPGFVGNGMLDITNFDVVSDAEVVIRDV